jgi:hypothetical protein
MPLTIFVTIISIEHPCSLPYEFRIRDVSFLIHPELGEPVAE